MYKNVKLYSRELRSNLKRKAFSSSFEFLDYINGESIVTDIDGLNFANENIMIVKTNKKYNTKQNMK
jgi:hypothetical protein